MLFGPNGAGKTNVLEAVSLLSPGRGLRRAAPEDIARKPETLGWKISAEILGGGQTHQIETLAESGQARTLRINDKPAPQLALGRIARMLWLVPAMDRLWIEAADGRRRFLDRMTLSFLPDHGEAVLTYEKAMRERNRLLRDQVQDTGWYAALEARMAEAGARITANRRAALTRIAQANDGARTAFPAAELSLVSQTETADDILLDPDMLAEALARGRGQDMAAGRTLTGPHRCDLGATFAAKGIAAAQCSTGEQKALLISLILANARALATDLEEPPILLLDEVAAHLDEDRRAALYDELLALRAQAWLTGTGPELFAGLGTQAQAFDVTETDGISRMKEHNLP